MHSTTVSLALACKRASANCSIIRGRDSRILSVKISSVAALDLFCRSFINIKSSKGPSTDSCSTPTGNGNIEEEYPPIQR